MFSHISLPPDIQSQHRWFLRVQNSGADVSFETFTILLRNFAKLGEAGAFVARNADPKNCSMRIVRESRIASDTMEFLVGVACCDPRYARPLRNAVFAYGQILEIPVVEFRVESANLNPAEIGMEAEVNSHDVMSKRFYPEISTKLGVQIQANVPPNYRSGRRVTISCSNELSLQLIEDMIQMVDLWGSVLVAGYPSSEEELQNGESMILNVEGSQHDELTFEVLVDRFIAAEAAFSSLMNLLIIRTNRDNHVSIAVLE